MPDQADGSKDEQAQGTPIAATQVQDQLGELLSRVEFGKESFVITRRGKPAARLVPVEPEPAGSTA